MNYRWRKRIIVPIGLAAFGMWLLVGCIYLPFPEHKVDKGTIDFRELLQDRNGQTPLHQGMSRQAVIALLGRPTYSSQTTIAYRIYTESGLAVWPLCFQASSMTRTEYGLELLFDEHDLLIEISPTQADVLETYFFYFLPTSEERIPFHDTLPPNSPSIFSKYPSTFSRPPTMAP